MARYKVLPRRQGSGKWRATLMKINDGDTDLSDGEQTNHGQATCAPSICPEDEDTMMVKMRMVSMDDVGAPRHCHYGNTYRILIEFTSRNMRFTPSPPNSRGFITIIVLRWRVITERRRRKRGNLETSSTFCVAGHADWDRHDNNN